MKGGINNKLSRMSMKLDHGCGQKYERENWPVVKIKQIENRLTIDEAGKES